ncbi:hypothetical protein MJD09_21605, partial [bacterium]|nr:hypothetical protein [bacterium]
MFPRDPIHQSLKFGFLVLLMAFLQGVTLAQVNHTYPRTAVQHFGKARPEWYAKFDLSLIIHTNVDRAKRIKEINPNATVVWVDGWTSYGKKNYVQDYIPREAPEYFAQGPDGNKLKLTWGELLDMSDLCPKVNGERYLDRHPKHLASLVDLTVFDGIGSDWCWGRPHDT